MDDKTQDLIINLLVASAVIFMIMLPRFCFRVSEKDYEKFKKDYYQKLIEEEMEKIKEGKYQFEPDKKEK